MGITEEEEAKAEAKGFVWREQYLFILVLIIVLLITGAIFLFRDRLEGLEGYGYLGAFVIGAMSSATIILPVPGLLIIFALGSALNPILVGLLAGGGSGLGELTGYMAGYGSKGVIEKRKFYLRLEQWMRRRGSITIFAFSLLPFLPFDVAGFVAGAVRFPLWKFFLFCSLGRVPLYIGVGYASDWFINLIQRLGG